MDPNVSSVGDPPSDNPNPPSKQSNPKEKFVPKPPKRKKGGIGKKKAKKNKEVLLNYRVAVAAEVAHPPPPETTFPVAEHPKPKRKSNERADSNWRVQRGISSREAKIAKLENQIVDAESRAAKTIQRLEGKNETLTTNYHRAVAEKKKSVAKKNKAVEDKMALKHKNKQLEEDKKQLTLEKRDAIAEHMRDKKVSRVLIEQARAEAEAAMEEAYAEADANAAKAIAAEEARLLAERESAERLRAERQRLSDQHLRVLSREKGGYEAIIAHIQTLHGREKEQWQSKMDLKDELWLSERMRLLEEVVSSSTIMNHLFTPILYSCLFLRIYQQDNQKAKVHEEKKKRREAVAKEVSQRRQLQNDVDELYDWIDELGTELRETKRETKAALKAKDKAESRKAKANELASKRLTMMKELKVKLGEVQDELATESKRADALERMKTIRIQIKRERPVGRRGGSGRWPVHIVLLICEIHL